MDRKQVESSVFRSIGYDPTQETLEIEFHHGGVYQYHGVPPRLHDQLMAAPSKGAIFQEQIVGQFSFVRVG